MYLALRDMPQKIITVSLMLCQLKIFITKMIMKGDLKNNDNNNSLQYSHNCPKKILQKKN